MTEVCGKQAIKLIDENMPRELPFYIWPADNRLLAKGLSGILASLRPWSKVGDRDIIFVDISVQTFHAIIIEEWFMSFRNCRLILVCDKKMTPFAHYWYLKMLTLGISGTIIYPMDTMDEIVKKISSVINGFPIITNAKIPFVSLREFNIMKLIFSGADIEKIASFCNVTVKTVYAYKSKIERKIMIPINRIPRM
ncbi:LuxR C-terminal-related transcriptional regulator [Citrobacter sedlakii]|uniref:LuxR C-terminal-related transcriptional regulator n=1 Tax=Citrobacter sedlakii TaxID=67826 RepID=UPI001BA6F570|nr:LuxR C-terminal-related transcriptional regulator [Citrobacter sedlakii]EKJ8220873.1 hypothetical protein [Citrobacter sedlakii]QUC29630.1 hypothetical protein JY391_19255 [Citrobacter sedlakii]